MAKPDKLYVIVDPDEGVLVVRLNNKGRAPKVTGAIHAAKSAADLKSKALKTLEFAVEVDGHANPALRTSVEKAYGKFKSKGANGVVFAIGVQQDAAAVVKGAKSASFVELRRTLKKAVGGT